MHVDYPLPGTVADNAASLDRERKNIELLKQKLIKTGYSPGEVEYLVHQFTGGTRMKNLSAKQLHALKDVLQQQLDLATRCLQIP